MFFPIRLLSISLCASSEILSLFSDIRPAKPLFWKICSSRSLYLDTDAFLTKGESVSLGFVQISVSASLPEVEDRAGLAGINGERTQTLKEMHMRFFLKKIFQTLLRQPTSNLIF